MVFHDAGDSVIEDEGCDLNGKAQRLSTMIIGQFPNCLEYALNLVYFSASAYSTYIVSFTTSGLSGRVIIVAIHPPALANLSVFLAT